MDENCKCSGGEDSSCCKKPLDKTSEEKLKNLCDHLHKHPTETALFAFAAGLLAGLLLRKR